MRLALIASLCFAAAIGEASAVAPQETEPAILTLVVNGLEHGSLVVQVRGEDVLVPKEGLREAGFRDLSGHSEVIGGIRYVSLASMKNVSFSRDDSVLRVSAEPGRFGATAIDLGRGPPRDMVYAEATSGFLNYSARAIDTRLDLFAETGMTWKRLFLYTSASAPSGGAPVRGLTNATWDDRTHMRRLIAGDHPASGGPLGGAAIVGGFHLARSFELNPYLVTNPSVDLRGSVLTPSTAEVYVDGALVSRQHLPPGAYELENLPAASGAGDAQVVVRDAFGRESEVSTSYYRPSGLLARGLSDYHLTVGAPRQDVGISSFDYSSPVLLGRYRRGIRRWLTGGARIEGSLGLLSGGFSAGVLTPVGQVETAAAASVAHGGGGAAASVSWGYRGRRLGAGSSLRVSSARYATVDVAARHDRPLFDARALMSAAITSRISAGVTYAASRWRDAAASDRASLKLAMRLASGYQISTTASYNRLPERPPELALLATLTFSLGARVHGTLLHEQGDAENQTRFDVHRSLPRKTGVGFRAFGGVGENTRGRAGATAQTSFGRYSAAYGWSGTEGYSEITAAGGVAVLGGRLFPTRPIQGSLALVRVPGVEGVGVNLANQEVGRTDNRGDLIVPELLPYYGNQISIDMRDLPADHTASQTKFTIAPPWRGGVVISFPVRRLRLVRGTVAVSAADKALVPAYGELTVTTANAPPSSPLGAGGEFELDGLEAGKHAARVEWSGGRCELDLEVPDGHDPIIYLGEVLCLPLDLEARR